VVGGYVIEAIGFGALFLASAVSAMLSAVLLVGFLRRRRGPASPEWVVQSEAQA
jgi:predicted MFS family arabinose efflux permease